MFKNITIVILLIMVLILGGTSGVFGYLYFTKNNEYADLLARALEGGSDISPATEEDSATTPTIITFEDTPLDVSFNYPSTWSLAMGTNVSEDFAYEPVYGRILQNYKATLTKGTSVLTFEKNLGAIDGFPSLVDKSTVDFVEVSGDLIRYKQPAETKWKYVQWMSCDDFAEMFGSPAATEVCLSSFYPGFGNWANIAYISASSEADLLEADQIVVSALN